METSIMFTPVTPEYENDKKGIVSSSEKLDPEFLLVKQDFESYFDENDYNFNNQVEEEIEIVTLPLSESLSSQAIKLEDLEATEDEKRRFDQFLINRLGVKKRISVERVPNHKRIAEYCCPNFNEINEEPDTPILQETISKLRRVLSEIERKKRALKVLSKDKVPVARFSSFDNEKLNFEFTKIFGHISKGELRDLLFVEYKTGRLEDLTEWTKHEKLCKREMEKNTEKSLQRRRKIEKDLEKLTNSLRHIMPTATMKDKSILNPEIGRLRQDFCLVPRRYFEFSKDCEYLKLRERRQGQLEIQQSTFAMLNAEEEESFAGAQPLNLAVYDPKVSEYNTFLNNEESGNLDVFNDFIDFELMGKKILVELSDLIDKYPLGICLEKFHKEFYMIYKFIPFDEEFEKYVKALVDIFHVDRFEDVVILFPAIIGRFIEPIFIMISKVWHLIRVLMIFHDNILELAKIPRELLRIFSVSMLPLDDWKITMEEFVSHCIKEYGTSTYEIIKTPTGSFLISLRLKKEIPSYELKLVNFVSEEKKIRSSVILRPFVSIPEGMVQPGELPTYMANLISPGMITAVLVLRVPSLSKMICINEHYWDLLEAFQAELQEYVENFNIMRQNKRLKPIDDPSRLRFETPRNETIQKNMIVAFQPSQSKQWYRGRVLKVVVVDDPDRVLFSYNILQFDYGMIFKNIDISQIMFLPKKFLLLEAQAIPCSLEVKGERENSHILKLPLFSGTKQIDEFVSYLKEGTNNRYKAQFLRPKTASITGRKGTSRVERKFNEKTWIIQLNKYSRKIPNGISEDVDPNGYTELTAISTNVGREFIRSSKSTVEIKKNVL